MVKKNKDNLTSYNTSIYFKLKSFYDKNPRTLYTNQDLKNAGMKEYGVITKKVNLLKSYEKNIIANELMLILFKDNKEEEKVSDLKNYLTLNPIINYYDNFIKIFKDSIIADESLNNKIINVIKKILLNSDSDEVIKFGLIISPIINMENLEEILKVYSIHNEYIFYVINSFEYIGGHNNDIFEIAKISKGYGRVFCVMNLRPTTFEIKRWLVEDSGDNSVGIQELLSYGMLSLDLLDYIEHANYKNEDVEIIAKAFCILFSEYSIDDIKNGKKVCNKLIDVIDKGNGEIYSLYVVISILYLIESMIIEDYKETNKFNLFIPNKEYNDITISCEKICTKESWHKIISEQILNTEIESSVLISCVERTNYKLKKKEFETLLLRDFTDPLLYKYAFSIGNKTIRKCAIKIGLEKLPLNKMLSGQDELTIETLAYEDIVQICFFVIIKYTQYEELEDKYKEINLKALKSPLIETRTQASLNLKRFQEEFDDLDIEIIYDAINTEVLRNIRKNLDALLNKPQSKQKKYVEIHDNMHIDAHIKDINLITLNIAGTQYVDMSEVYNKLIEGEMLYLKRDSDNIYDDNAIEVITIDGYIIGFIPRENNLILKNLLDKGKYLYGLIEELNDDYSQIIIKIYLSYRDVIEEITSTLSLLSSEKENLLQ